MTNLPDPPNKTTGMPSQKSGETGLQSFASLCTSAIAFLFAITFIFQNFMIPSASMASTLLVGDHVAVDRSSLAPAARWAPLPYRDLRHNEPVVFYKPVPETGGDHMILVKRVVGLPGDRIHLRRGILYVNGIAQNEPQTAKPTDADYDPYRDDFPSIPGDRIPGVTAEWAATLPAHIEGEDLVIPPDSYFVMGDNRTNSLDARYWGFVPRANLIGRPLFIYWSFVTPDDQEDKTTLADRTGFTLHQVLHFFDETRWRRTLQRVN